MAVLKDCPGKNVLKAEFHSHTSDDPIDFIPYDNLALIDHAAARGYQVLAITLHDRQIDVGYIRDYARERGIVLVPGVERTLHGRHVLLLNFPAAADGVATFDDIRRLKQRSNGLVVAPHPFFPTSACLGALLDRHADLFDAVEINGFYTSTIDFNRRARQWAETNDKPLVGNCDVHRLAQLGTTYSVIDAEPDVDAVCDAIRVGRVDVCTRPISLVTAASHFGSMLLGDTVQRLWPRRTDPVPTVA